MAFEGEDARRWAIVDAPTLQPAVDFITKSPNGPFIDTGVNVTFEMRGRMYLSVETIKEMAEIAGLLEARNAQEANLHELDIYNKGYEAGLKEGEELYGKLVAVVDRLRGVDYSTVIRDVEIVEDSEGESGVESGISDGDSDNIQDAPVRKRKSGGKTVATNSVKGPDDVSSLNGDDEYFKL
jgi:activator of HSP90 ATPase